MDKNFHKKTIFTCNPIRFDNLGRIDKHLHHAFKLARHCTNSCMSRYSKTEDCRVN